MFFGLLRPGGTAADDPGLARGWAGTGKVPQERARAQVVEIAGAAQKTEPKDRLGCALRLLWALPGRAVGCDERGGRSEERPAAGRVEVPLGRNCSSFFLLAAVLQGQKIASSEKSTKVTDTLPEKNSLTSGTASGCGGLGAENRDRPWEIWISPDPMRKYSSPYTYVGNNPIIYLDPNGDSTIEAGGS